MCDKKRDFLLYVWWREVFMWVHLSVEMGNTNPLDEEMDKQIQQSLVRVGFEELINDGSDLEFWIEREGVGQNEL